MEKKYELTPWPRRIYVDQEGGFRAINVDIYDAETREKLLMVFSIAVSHREGTWLRITQSKYTPFKPVLYAEEDEASSEGFEQFDGVVTETREYPITRLNCEAGL